jgi:hypothetical protein
MHGIHKQQSASQTGEHHQNAARRRMRQAMSAEAADEPNIVDQPLDSRPFSTGTKAENQLPADDDTMERMVQEGLDEAEADERVAAEKSTKSEG